MTKRQGEGRMQWWEWLLLAGMAAFVWWAFKTGVDKLDKVPGHGAYSTEYQAVAHELSQQEP
jgi:hypothetical protein